MPLVDGWKTGVYCWKNIVNGKVYVGGGYKDVQKRLLAHRKKLRANVHCNRYFQAAWNKYGQSKFRPMILERCKPSKVQEREQYWIDHLKAVDRRYGYNLAPTAGSTLGFRMSEDQRSRLSFSRIGRVGTPHSVETKAKLSLQRRGRKLSREWVANMSSARKGKPKSEEHKEKMKANHWSRSDRAEEVRKQIGLANSKRVWSEESKAKLSNSKKRK